MSLEPNSHKMEDTFNVPLSQQPQNLLNASPGIDDAEIQINTMFTVNEPSDLRVVKPFEANVVQSDVVMMHRDINLTA